MAASAARCVGRSADATLPRAGPAPGADQAQGIERFGGSFSAIAAAWLTDPAPHRSTVLRWLRSGTYPKSAQQLLALAGALDVDPFSLWIFRLEAFDVLRARISRLARRRRGWSRLHAALSFLEHFIGSTAEWPPIDIADQYFGRPWWLAEFEHTARARRNYYTRALIESSEPAGFEDPQVWHFAYRDSGVRDAEWRPYGFIQRMGPELSLFNFNGLTDHAEIRPGAVRLHVETWFGEGAARIRVASLHGYRLSLATAPESGIARVQFALPS